MTQFRFVNPHAMMLMDVTDKSGKVVKWNVEFAGRLNLEESGWTANSIKPGERVKVTGNPAWTSPQRMAFVKLVRADGTELDQGAAQRLSAVEEERRQRADKRTPSQPYVRTGQLSWDDRCARVSNAATPSTHHGHAGRWHARSIG